MSNKEVSVQGENEVSSKMASMFDSGLESSGDNLDKADLRIPKLTLIQSNTKEAFNSKKVAVSNYIDSISKADMGSSLELFVMMDIKLWEVKYTIPVKGAGKKAKEEYLGTIDYTMLNQDLKDNPRIPPELSAKAEELGIDDTMISKVSTVHRFYVLLVNEVKEGTAFPYVIDFKGGSVVAGINLKNAFYKLRRRTADPRPSYGFVTLVGTEFIQGEFDYYAKTAAVGRLTEMVEVKAIEGWLREMVSNKAAYRDDESDTESEDSANTFDATANAPQEGQPKF